MTYKEFMAQCRKEGEKRSKETGTKKYRATKKNVILLEKSLTELYGAEEKLSAERDYQSYKNLRRYNERSTVVNHKMQEIENR